MSGEYIQDEIDNLKEKVAGHEVRFQNGREVMADIKKQIDDLKPKAPDWMKYFLATLSVVGVLMGAQLWLSEKFNVRPTRSEVNAKIDEVKVIQKETSKKISNIEATQGVQSVSITHIQSMQREILDKVTAPPDRRRRRSP